MTPTQINKQRTRFNIKYTFDKKYPCFTVSGKHLLLPDKVYDKITADTWDLKMMQISFVCLNPETNLRTTCKLKSITPGGRIIVRRW